MNKAPSIFFLGTGCDHLKENMPVPVSCATHFFDDGEIYFEYDGSVVNKNVVIFQSLSPPVNDRIIELLVMVDALKNSFCNKITVAIPYLGYSRQDRLSQNRTALSAKIIAKLIGESGINEVVVFDIHSPQQIGFFKVPVKELSGCSLFTNYFMKIKKENTVIVSPDIGGIKRAEMFASKLNLPLVIINKKRSLDGKIKDMELIGTVNQKNCLLVDDIIDSGNTLIKASNLLIKNGALSVDVFATHAVFSNNAQQNLEQSPIQSIYITDTIHQNLSSTKIKILSIVDMLMTYLNQ
ncbi:MAG: Ribose-phosphate pyrophosphokinase [Holosporales bacterium]